MATAFGNGFGTAKPCARVPRLLGDYRERESCATARGRLADTIGGGLAWSWAQPRLRLPRQRDDIRRVLPGKSIRRPLPPASPRLYPEPPAQRPSVKRPLP